MIFLMNSYLLFHVSQCRLLAHNLTFTVNCYSMTRISLESNLKFTSTENILTLSSNL